MPHVGHEAIRTRGTLGGSLALGDPAAELPACAVALDDGRHEFHVVPDRTVPLDYEVYDVVAASGFDDRGEERRFLPLFAPDHRSSNRTSAYYSAWREPRLP